MSTMHPTDINAALVNLVRKRSPERWQTVPIGLTPLWRPDVGADRHSRHARLR